jgi:hypothetical protein
MRNLKSNISFEDFIKFDRTLVSETEGVPTKALFSLEGLECE